MFVGKGGVGATVTPPPLSPSVLLGGPPARPPQAQPATTTPAAQNHTVLPVTRKIRDFMVRLSIWLSVARGDYCMASKRARAGSVPTFSSASGSTNGQRSSPKNAGLPVR